MHFAATPRAVEAVPVVTRATVRKKTDSYYSTTHTY